jgi:hypothetical protein
LLGRLGRALRLLGAGGLGGARQLGGAKALLHSGQVGVQSAHDLARIPWPLVRVDLQAVPVQADQLCVGAAGFQPPQGVGRVAADRRVQDGPACRAGVDRLAGEDLAEDRPEAEDVGALVHQLDVAAGLLGRHVGRGANPARPRWVGVRTGAHRLNDAHSRIGAAIRRLVGLAALGQHLGQAPVDHLHFSVRADHDVGRLDVAVNHAPGMRVRHCLADGLEDR